MGYTCETTLAVSSKCVSVALVTQHAKWMYLIILSSVVCLALPYFSTLSHEQQDFSKKKKVIEHKMCVLIFSTTTVCNICHSKNMVRYYKCTLVFTYSTSFSSQTLIFSTDFLKILKYQISWKSIQWELCCSMWTDGQTWWSWQLLLGVLWMHLKEKY